MTITADDIPQDWKAMLSAIQRVCPSAVLAGGCLRDLDNGLPVKDLDVFINAHYERDARAQIDLLIEAGIEIDFAPDEASAYPEDQNLEVVAIVDCDSPATDLPVQFIFTTWPTNQIVNRFDYGICRLAFDGTELVVPAEYEEDKGSKVFRLRRERPTPAAMIGSVHRYARLTAEKYHGWTWEPWQPSDDDFEKLL